MAYYFEGMLPKPETVMTGVPYPLMQAQTTQSLSLKTQSLKAEEHKTVTDHWKPYRTLSKKRLQNL